MSWFNKHKEDELMSSSVPTPWPPLHQDWPTESRGLEDPVEEVKVVPGNTMTEEHTHTAEPHIEGTPEDIRSHCLNEANRLTNEACDALDLAYRHLKIANPETAERVRKLLNDVVDLADHTETLTDA